MFTFADHGRAAAAKTSRRNNILRALAGTSWGKQKETLLTTYQGSRTANTQLRGTGLDTAALRHRLQTAPDRPERSLKNRLRLSRDELDHLHQETAMLPVRDQNVLLTDRFYAPPAPQLIRITTWCTSQILLAR